MLSPTNPREVDLFSREGLTPAEAISPLTKQLLPWAIVLLLLDIAVRRIAWDRWVSKRMGAASVIATERAAMSMQRQQLATVGASVGELRRASESIDRRVESVQQSAKGLVLSDEDARSLAAAARDKRRATRLTQNASAQATAGESSPGQSAPGATSGGSPASATQPSSPASEGKNTSETPADSEPSGLLAAKRRANRKYER
jgi:hypothetical protein